MITTKINNKIMSFRLDISTEQAVHLPAGYKILSVQAIDGNIYLNILAVPGYGMNVIFVWMYHTGDIVPDHPYMEFIGSVKTADDVPTFHVFSSTKRD